MPESVVLVDGVGVLAGVAVLAGAEVLAVVAAYRLENHET